MSRGRRLQGTMAKLVLVLVLVLVLQTCSCALTNEGCMRWVLKGDESCCEACFPGHRVVKKCGRRVIDLCTPCEPGTFTLSFNKSTCEPCRQCAGAEVHLKNCTPTSDTQCGCKEGLVCADDRCSSCVRNCPKGGELADDGSCRPCPDGTFNDGLQVKCKPWSTRCLKPDQRIVARGDAFTDIECAALSDPESVVKPETPDDAYVPWLLVTLLFASVAVTIFVVSVVSVVAAVVRSKKRPEKPIIQSPTDDPQTLIAIECSFHEAEQEQGSSSESSDSNDSSGQLI